MDPPTTTSSTAKRRVMCSYGGHIVPRPRTNSLCYAGGDTRMVAFDPHAVTTLSAFVAHLSSYLSFNFSSFALKYQLPHLDLDSLISLASDEDFHIFIDELTRLSSSPSPFPTPSRIRLFLFPTNPDSGRPVIRHPKTEAWFFDALKSAKIMQKGRHCLMGLEGEHHHQPQPEEFSSGELTRTFISSGPESMVLDTSSSFGSTSSSASLTNLPRIRAQAHAEDNETILKDGKVKLTSSDTIPSDNTVSGIMPQQQNVSYQDPVVHASEARVNAESIEVESKIPNISSGVIANNMKNMDLGYSSFPRFDQVQRPHLQFVQAGAHFLPLHPSGLLPVPSCQQYIYQQPRPLQHLVYRPNQPCPVYLVPVGKMPPNNLPTTASSQTSLNLNASFMNFHVAQNSEGAAGPPFAHDIASENYITDNAATSFVQIPYNGSQQREMDVYPMHHQSQTISITSKECPKYGNEFDDDLVHAQSQIYKSQPPPPTLPSKYQTMTKATTALLSEAFAQLHVDNPKQQTETSQPL